MHADIAAKRDALKALCERYDVARLEVFGSAARGVDFDPAASDVDFLAHSRPQAGSTRWSNSSAWQMP
jgi:uncharacterized protein